MNADQAISFVTFNIEGLWSVCNELDLASFVLKYDFVLLVETFTETVPDSVFPSHKPFVSPGVKVSDSIHGRLSGGFGLLVRKKLCEYVERIDVETDNIIALRLSHRLLGTPTDCLLDGAYLPPEKSPYYEETDIYNGVSLLEDCLLDLIRVCGDIPFIICGDLNARTASMNARNVDPIDDIYEMNSDNHSESRTPVDNDTRRTSKDNTVNSFGRYLIGICEEFGLSILNGLQSLNFSGDFTYISQTGCSLVDYFMISASMLSKCRRFNVIPMVESKHLAVEMSIVTVNNYVTVKGTVPKAFSVVKYKWDEEKSVNFAYMMQTKHVQALLDEAESLIGCDINQAFFQI